MFNTTPQFPPEEKFLGREGSQKEFFREVWLPLSEKLGGFAASKLLLIYWMTVVVSLFKRNAIVALAFMLLLTILRLLSGGYVPPLIAMVIVLLIGLMWANAILINRGRPIAGTLLSLLLVPTIGLLVLKGSVLVGHRFVEWRYKAQGLELVYGCNALAANMASFDVFMLRERLAELKDSPNADSNQIVRVENAYTAAQEKARILSEDCRRRGHCENHPWKSHWDTIKQVSAASRQTHQ